MRFSTDFCGPENLEFHTHFSKFCVYSALLLFSLMMQAAQAQNCESASENRATVVRHYNIWAKSHKELTEKCYSSGSAESKKNSKRVPYYSEMDNDGNIHHYVGRINFDGDLVWKETDENPNKYTESGLSQDDPCRDEILASQREGDALAAIAGTLNSIPCYVYIQMIFCDGFEKETCSIHFFEADWQKPEYKKREEQWRKEFYAKVKVVKAQIENISSSIARQRAISTGEFLQKKESEENSASSKSATVNTIRDDIVRREFTGNINISEIRGERIDENRDGKIDFVEVAKSDGSIIYFHDDNGDGRLDWLAVKRPEGTQTLLIDSNNDGSPDQKVELTSEGKPTYLPLESPQPNLNEQRYKVDLSSDPKNILATISKINWSDWQKHQPSKPGEDGFVTLVHPQNLSEKGDSNGPKYYFVNGVLNEYSEARNSAQLIANSVGKPVVLVYSASAKQNDSSLPVVPDATQAIAYRLGAGSTGATALETSLLLDLSSGREVRVFSHSRGAALTYNAVTELQKTLDNLNLGDRIGNLSVVTLGGFSPPAEKWTSEIKVVDVANQYDAIPWLAGHGALGSHAGNVSLDTHPVSEYMKWILFFGQEDIDKRVFEIKSFPTLVPPDKLKRR